MLIKKLIENSDNVIQGCINLTKEYLDLHPKDWTHKKQIITSENIAKDINKFLNYSIDCRLISPESKFKFTEGLDSEAGFDF